MACTHDNTEGRVDGAGQWVLCHDCEQQFCLSQPEKGWHTP